MPDPMPLITLDKCKRLARVIHILMSEKQENLAAELLKASLYDPVHLMKGEENELGRLEKMLKNDEEHGIKDFINLLSMRQQTPPSES